MGGALVAVRPSAALAFFMGAGGKPSGVARGVMRNANDLLDIGTIIEKFPQEAAMPETPSRTHGGVRPGAGRTLGSGYYGEPTGAVRVPVSLLPILRAWLNARGQGLPAAARPAARTPPAAGWPLFGARVPAGFPSPADDHLEDALDLNAHLIRHPAATFFVRVQGDSMTGAGIQDGDLLVVDRALEPRPGSVVVAVVDGELVVKRLALAGGQVWLRPENPEYPPLEIREGMDLVIWGVVAHVVHSL